MALIEAKLADSGAGKQYQIARGSGMAGLLAAIGPGQGSPPGRPTGNRRWKMPSRLFMHLSKPFWPSGRGARRNAEKIYRDCAAIYDTDGEETCTAAPTTTPNMSASNE